MLRLPSLARSCFLAAASMQPAIAQDLAQIHARGRSSARSAKIADSRIAVMVPMRDGVRLSTNIYTPAGARTAGLPVILWKTPYNEHSSCAARRCAMRSRRCGAAMSSSSRRRARPLFLRRQMRDPRLAADRRLRRAELDRRHRTGRTARSARSAAPPPPNGSSRWPPRTIPPMPRWCRCRRAPASARSAASRSRATGTPAACRAACSSSGSTASTIRSAPSSRPTSTRRCARAPVAQQRSRRDQAQGRLEPSRSSTCRSTRCSRSLGEPPATFDGLHQPHARRSGLAQRRALSLTTWAGAYRRCGSTAGTTCRSAPISSCSTTPARARPTRRPPPTNTP